MQLRSSLNPLSGCLSCYHVRTRFTTHSSILTLGRSICAARGKSTGSRQATLVSGRRNAERQEAIEGVESLSSCPIGSCLFDDDPGGCVARTAREGGVQKGEGSVKVSMRVCTTYKIGYVTKYRRQTLTKRLFLEL